MNSVFGDHDPNPPYQPTDPPLIDTAGTETESRKMDANLRAWMEQHRRDNDHYPLILGQLIYKVLGEECEIIEVLGYPSSEVYECDVVVMDGAMNQTVLPFRELNLAWRP